MPDAPWYAMEDAPPGRLMVRLFWNARQFVAARIWHAKGKRWRWATIDGNGDYRSLPPGGKRGESWPDEPQCWQPIDPKQWTWPAGRDVPTPLPVQVTPRLVDIRPRKHDERLPVDDCAGNRTPAGNGNHGYDWWRDASAISYAAIGTVSLRMTEGRLMRALAHCGETRPRGRQPTTRTMDAEIAACMQEMEANDSRVVAARFKALPQDHSDFDIAMAWFAALNPPELWHKRREPWSLNRLQWVLIYRALDVPLTFAEIAHEFHVKQSRAHVLYRDAIEACWRVANGKSAYKHLSKLDRMAALRERNTFHHRRTHGATE